MLRTSLRGNFPCRYAFQSDEKLYLITDYYSGGSLFYHLRKARGFSENRTRFYGAELLLALAHLHDNHIIYRDLKLEVTSTKKKLEGGPHSFPAPRAQFHPHRPLPPPPFLARAAAAIRTF